MKKIIAVLLIIGLLPVSIVAFASDYDTHWAKEQIEYLISTGIVSGDASGVRPDDYILRAEFVKIINRSFNFNTPDENTFNDISANDWYYNEMLCAKKAGYLMGDADGNCNPKKNLTRAEAAVIYFRLLNPEVKNPRTFNDSSDIPSWAIKAVNALSSIGIINGYEDGTFRASKALKRAEAFHTLVKSQQYGGDVALEDSSVKKEDYVAPNSGNVSAGGGGGGGGGSASGGNNTNPGISVVEITSLENNIAIWKNVNGAINYTVAVTRITEGKNKISSTPVNVNGLSYDFSSDVANLMPDGDTLIQEKFEVKVTANMSSGASVSDVAEKTINNLHPGTPVLSDVLWQYENSTEKYVISWSSTPSETYHVAADSYKIKITKEDGSVIADTVVSSAIYGYTPSVEIINEGIEKVNVEIIACAADCLDSPPLNTLVDILYKGGDGSEESPYLIATKRHFDNISKYPSAKYRIVSDITEAVTESINLFSGELTGWDETHNTFAQRRVRINLDAGDIYYVSASAGSVIGLFSSITGTVSGITTEGSVSCDQKGIFGAAFAGHIDSTGNISNIINNATVNVTGSSCQFGGIAGICFSGKISYCVNNANIKSTYYAGGIIGKSYVQGNLSTLMNTGKIEASYAGGITAEIRYYLDVSDSFNIGEIAGSSFGAGIGAVFHSSATPSNSIVKNCYTMNSNNLVPAEVVNSSVINSFVFNNNTESVLTNEDILKNYGWNFDKIWTIDLANTGFECPQFIKVPYIAPDYTLNTPDFSLYFSGTDITLTINNFELKALKYNVSVTKEGESNSVCFELTEPKKIITSADNIIDIANTSNVKYNISVKALGNGLNIYDSSEKTTEYIHQKPAIASPVISANSTYVSDEAYTFSWTSSDDRADGYKIAISGDDTIPDSSDYVDVYDETSYTYTLPSDFTGAEINVYVYAYSNTGLYRDSEAISQVVDVSYAGGEGSLLNPYLIETLRQFSNITYNSDKCFKLINDIGSVSNPLTSSVLSFSGDLNGNNKTVYMNISANKDTVGLFDKITGAVKVYDLKLDGSITNTKSSGKAAGLSGMSDNISSGAEIKNVLNSADITATSGMFVAGIIGSATGKNASNLLLITDCKNEGKITSKYYGGGIVGYAVNIVISGCANVYTDSQNSGYVYCSNHYTGGIAGSAQVNATIEKSYNTADVKGNYCVGGISGIAEHSAKINNCYNTGAITSMGSNNSGTAGGILGGVKTDSAGRTGTVKYCYNIGTITTGSNTSLFNPVASKYNNSSNPTSFISVESSYYLSDNAVSDETNGTEPLTSSEMKDSSKFIDWDFNSIWKMGTNGPELQ